LAGYNVKSAHFTCFMAIALKARPSQVLVIILATVFPRDDVIRLMMFRANIFGK